MSSSVLCPAADSAARPGSCRKPPCALYVVLGRKSVDFGRAAHYSCLPLGACTVTANSASSYGIVFTAPATPAPPTPAPVSPPAAAPYPYPGNADPGGYPESSDSGAGYAINVGAFTCAGGAISVSAPEVAATVGFGSVDYYRDSLWWWDTSTGTWRFWKEGPIQSRTRGGGWVDLLTGRPAPGPSVYLAQPEFSYDVTQQVGDGYTRASHNVSATSLTGAGAPYCVL